MRADLDRGAHRAEFRCVRQSQAELAVDSCTVVSSGSAEDGAHITERFNQAVDVSFVHRVVLGSGADTNSCERGRPVRLHLGGPDRDQRRIGTGFQRGAVSGELRVALGGNSCGVVGGGV